jgi:hypothetical protein
MAKTDHFCNRAEAYEAHDNEPLSPADGDSIGDIILRRYSRREMMLTRSQTSRTASSGSTRSTQARCR